MKEAVVSSSPLPRDLHNYMNCGKRGVSSYFFRFEVHFLAEHCIEIKVIHNDLMMIGICAVTRNNENKNKQFLFGISIAHHILWAIVGPYLEANYQTILLLVNEFDVVRKMPISFASVHRSLAHAWSHARSHLMRCLWFQPRGRKWVRMILYTFVLLRTMQNIFFSVIRNRIYCSTATAQQHQLQQREKPFLYSLKYLNATLSFMIWCFGTTQNRIKSVLFLDNNSPTS